MDLRVGGILKLLGHKVLGIRRQQSARPLPPRPSFPLSPGVRIIFAPKMAKHLPPFQRHGLRHGDMELIAFCRSYKGQGNAGIAAGRLDDLHPGFEQALAFLPSQIILAPIRHLTEYEGLRPSIFARIVALSPWAILLILTNGVLPIDNALSSKYFVILFSFLMLH